MPRVLVTGHTKMDGPQLQAMEFARANGFRLERQPFGKRGSSIEIYRADDEMKMLGYRKSYSAALNFMRGHVERREAAV